MANVIISAEHLSKSYRLGQIGTGTFANDLNLWWAKLRGKPSPLLRIGKANHGNCFWQTLMDTIKVTSCNLPVI